MDAKLKLEDLLIIKTKLFNARTKWEDIGLMLKIDSETLKSIKLENRENHEACLQKMLTKRLEAFGPLSWSEVCVCLRSPTVTRIDVAVEIEDWIKERETESVTNEEHMKMDQRRKIRRISYEGEGQSIEDREVFETSIEEDELTRRRKIRYPILLKRTFQNLCVSKLSAIEITAKLPRLFLESSELSLKFSNLCFDLCCSIEKRNVSIKQVVSILIGIEAFPPVYKFSKQALFRDQKPDLLACSDIHDVWFILKDYCSYFNYDLVNLITNRFGSVDDMERMSLYVKDFSFYAKRRLYECPVEFGSLNDCDCTIVVKLDKSYDDCTADQLIILEDKLCDIFNISQRGVLRLCTVEQGCYELVFQAPLFVRETVFPLSLEQEVALNELKVVWLLCGDYEFSASTFNQGSDGNFGPDDDADDDHPGDPSKEYNLMEQAHAVMQSSVTSSDYVPSDSGVGFDAETKSLFSEFTEDLFDHESQPSQNKQPLTDDGKTLIDSTCLIAATYNGNLLKVKFCLDVLHCDPLQHDSNGNTALNAAADGGQLEVLKYLAKYVEDNKHISVALPNSSVTVLHIAAFNGNLPMVKYLVEEVKIDPLLANNQQKTPLHNACRNGSIEVVTYLFDQAKHHDPTDTVVYDTTKMGTTILHFAAASGNCQLVKHLVSDLQVDPNAPGQFGATALLIAAQEGHLNVVQYLTDLSSCSISIKTRNAGQNALHIASRKGHLSIIKFLVSDKKFDPNIQDFAGYTPLHQAAQCGFFHVVKFFIEDCKCNLLCLSKKRRTPLHMAAMEGCLEVVDYLVKKINIEPLLKTISQVSPLHLAVLNGKTKVVDYYLDSLGCALNSPDRLGEKLLFKAVYHGHLPVVEQLVFRQVWMEKPTGHRQTQLLITAVQRGHLHILKYLAIECHWECVDNFYKKISLLKFAISSGHLNVVRFLISETCNLYHPEDKKSPPLHLACSSGHKHIVEFLIDEHGADPSQIDQKGRSPLHCAIYSGQCEIVKFLAINSHCDLNSKDQAGRTLLHYALLGNNKEIPAFLMKEMKCGPNIFDNEGRTPIFYAICSSVRMTRLDKDKTEILNYFIKNFECDPTIPSKDGKTALHVAAYEGDCVAVKFLTSVFKDFNKSVFSADNLGHAPLHKACFKGHLDVTEFLSSESDIEISLIVDKYRHSPLHYAAMNGRLQIIKFLVLSKSHDPHCQDIRGYTPYHIATESGDLQVVKLFFSEFKLDPNVSETTGLTSLLLACKHGHEKLVKYFVALPTCNMMCTDKNGGTCLHQAALNGQYKIVIILLDHCDIIITHQTLDGSTALHNAVTSNSIDTAKLLVSTFNSKQIDFNISNKQGHTPLDVACRRGSLEMAEFLLTESLGRKQFTDWFAFTTLLSAVVGNKVDIMNSLLLMYPKAFLTKVNRKRCDSVLHEAAFQGHIDATKLLIEKFKMDPNTQNRHGQTPLHTACQHGYMTIAEYLIGYDNTCCDIYGQSALHYAASMGHLHIVKLLVKNMNWFLLDANGATPCHFAAFKGFTYIVNYFIKEGQDPFMKDSKGRDMFWYINVSKIKGTVCTKELALHRATENELIGAVKYLIEEESHQPNCRDSLQRTPLHYAAMTPHGLALSHLIDAGSDIHAEDVFQNLPIHYAIALGRHTSVKILIGKGSSFTKRGVLGMTPLEIATMMNSSKSRERSEIYQTLLASLLKLDIYNKIK